MQGLRPGRFAESSVGGTTGMILTSGLGRHSR